MLFMLVAGIGFAQAVSDPRQVTLRWLRLGGLVALGLLATTIAVTVATEMDPQRDAGKAVVLFSLPVAAVMGQLMAVQLGWRHVQRALAVAVWAIGSLLVAAMLLGLLARGQSQISPWEHMPAPRETIGSALTAAGASALLGGMLMTMLLGHAYLTAGGEMTQAPFRRLVLALAVVLVLRAVLSVATGLTPWWRSIDTMGRGLAHPQAVWDVALLTARYLVGLVVPAVFLYMTWDCVRRRSNQSATGILYVTFVLLILGEGAALALMRSVSGALF